MSTPVGTDRILVEANSTTGGRTSGQIYRETKTNWDTAAGTGGGGGGGGGSATNGLAIQFAHASMGGFANSGSHFKITTGKLFGTRSDSNGAYGLTSTTTNSENGRPNTKLKIDNTWYEVIAGGNSDYSQTTGRGPFNVYYWRGMVSWTLTASEIQTACGATSGTISALAVKMDDAPTRTMPNHYIGVKLVSSGNADTNNTGSNNGSYTQVSFVNPRDWTSATEETYQEIAFSSNISWS